MPAFLAKRELRFEFHLARELGKTVAELRSVMPCKEFEQWKILSQVEAQEAKAREAKGNKGKR